ncbi:MAG: CPBP family intramembrane metalloprotease [Alphaproteobacteria bacterium]|nr:CPBP family intramembrane metalloprotease [Alphaproteobacteria bacterium]
MDWIAEKMECALTAPVTSIMWLALHLPEGMARVILLLPLTIALPLARHFGGSVRASIIVHACSNAIAVAMPWLAVWLGWLARP